MLVTVGALALAVIAFGVVAVADNPDADAVEVIVPAIAALAFTCSGLLAWRRRPHNRIRRVLAVLRYLDH